MGTRAFLILSVETLDYDDFGNLKGAAREIEDCHQTERFSLPTFSEYALLGPLVPYGLTRGSIVNYDIFVYLTLSFSIWSSSYLVIYLTFC